MRRAASAMGIPFWDVILLRVKATDIEVSLKCSIELLLKSLVPGGRPRRRWRMRAHALLLLCDSRAIARLP
jgi:hypothetical protein